ncbi:hypothetical protein AVEN_262450-1 [Araneus ventricosus]|uniref:Uncharacterized protein n=1 Tax=Araneus ventricosus TaxID=182803 RepID=A0A4Y2HTK3_ARAVE|nr:hypothetical protein AVEN_262450-1 [Araneus ventricosus]
MRVGIAAYSPCNLASFSIMGTMDGFSGLFIYIKSWTSSAWLLDFRFEDSTDLALHRNFVVLVERPINVLRFQEAFLIGASPAERILK